MYLLFRNPSQILLFVLGLACTSLGFSQKVSISGNLEGITNGKVYVVSLGQDVADSAAIKNGAFTFQKEIPAVELFNLSFKDTQGKTYMLRAPLPVEAGDHIRIAGDVNDIGNITAKGTKELEVYSVFRQEVKKEEDALYATIEKYKDAKGVPNIPQDAIQNLMALLGTINQKVYAFIDQHPKTLSATSALLYSLMMTPPSVDPKHAKELSNRLEKTYKNDAVVALFGNKLSTVLAVNKKNPVPEIAPDFTQNDANGKPVSLSSYRGKYVLVDFWASWCMPCRRENPNVVQAYHRYKSKNFEVLGVSLDENKTAWLNAISKDGLAWTHVSDLQGFRNAAARLYNINAIPANFLVNPEGKIVGVNLRGEELQQALDKILK